MARKKSNPHEIELKEMLEVVQKFQKRVEFIKSKGEKVDPALQAAIDKLSKDADALIAQHATNSQAAVDAVNAVDAKIVAATTPAP